MVRIVVDDYVIVVPVPVVNISDIKGSDAEVVSAEPEARRTASPEPPDEARSKTGLEMAVFPGMIQMESGIVWPPVMSDPFAVLVNVRCLGMSFLIAKRRVISRWSRRILSGPAEIVMVSGRPAARNIAATDGMTGSFSVIFASSAAAFVLGEESKGRYEQDCN